LNFGWDISILVCMCLSSFPPGKYQDGPSFRLQLYPSGTLALHHSPDMMPVTVLSVILTELSNCKKEPPESCFLAVLFLMCCNDTFFWLCYEKVRFIFVCHNLGIRAVCHHLVSGQSVITWYQGSLSSSGIRAVCHHLVSGQSPNSVLSFLITWFLCLVLVFPVVIYSDVCIPDTLTVLI
jgi:hypothetical protein